MPDFREEARVDADITVPSDFVHQWPPDSPQRAKEDFPQMWSLTHSAIEREEVNSATFKPDGFLIADERKTGISQDLQRCDKIDVVRKDQYVATSTAEEVEMDFDKVLAGLAPGDLMPSVGYADPTGLGLGLHIEVVGHVFEFGFGFVDWQRLLWFLWYVNTPGSRGMILRGRSIKGISEVGIKALRNPASR